MSTFQENELVLIIYQDRRYLKKLEPGKSFHGRGGMLQFSDVVGLPHGSVYGAYYLYAPTLEDIIMSGVRRETQIIYPKDSTFICFKLNLRPGSRVLEVGTGSGALTLFFSRAVGPGGRVVSIEKEARHHLNAKKNLQKFGELDNVELLLGDIMEYDGEGGFDAVFVDMREPWDVMDKVRGLLTGSGPIGMIVPTANQVSEILNSLGEGFGDVEVLEILVRKYKTVAERFRPMDRMIAHTGYLIFGRKIARVIVQPLVQRQDAPETDGPPSGAMQEDVETEV